MGGWEWKGVVREGFEKADGRSEAERGEDKGGSNPSSSSVIEIFMPLGVWVV